MCYHWVPTKECLPHHDAELSKVFQMITIPEVVAQALGSFLTSDTKNRFGSSHARLAEVLPFAARLTLECIGNSDALYHNIEHTLLVTLAGQDILMGQQMLRQTSSHGQTRAKRPHRPVVLFRRGLRLRSQFATLTRDKGARSRAGVMMPQ